MLLILPLFFELLRVGGDFDDDSDLIGVVSLSVSRQSSYLARAPKQPRLCLSEFWLLIHQSKFGDDKHVVVTWSIPSSAQIRL